jgi:hypothetical protein
MVACDFRLRRHESSSRVRGVGSITGEVKDGMWIGSAGAAEPLFSILGSDR